MLLLGWLIAAVVVGIVFDWKIGVAMWAVPAGIVFIFSLFGVGLISGRRG